MTPGSAGLLGPDATVGGLLRRLARERPDQPFLMVGTDPWLSYRDLDDVTDRVAAGLAALGVGRGDRVALVCTNRVEAIEVLLACAKLGAILVPLNYHLRGEFLLYQLNDCGAEVLVVDGPGSAMSQELRPQTSVRTVVQLDSASAAGEDGDVTYAELRAATGAPPGPELGPDLGPGDLISILYTSGTTGHPKGCELSHGYYLAGGRSVRESGWVVPGDRVLTAFPHFHTSFQINTFMSALANDAALVVEPSFHASTLMRRAKDVAATMIWGLGTMAMAILAQPARPDDRVDGLRLSAWVPLHPEAQLEFERRFGGRVNCEIFGQTEAVPIVLSRWDAPTRRPFTFGVASPLYDVRIVDGLDHELPPGQVGEIVLRPTMPHAMFSGYWRKPAETVRVGRNLWHHTGDLGVLDADGVLSFKDRGKDAIRRRGENVSCFELELAIGQHPDVAEVAAIAVPSPMGEDDILVAIVPAPGSTPDAQSLFDFFRDRLPYFAVPRYVDLRASFPTTATGRVRKDLLRAEGVTATTWDLQELGLVVTKEDRRSARPAQATSARSGPEAAS